MNFCGCVFTVIGEMGCVSSKVENEEIVSRCRERRRLMKQAVNSRHNFAAAHSAYLRALKNTGIALQQFAEGESMTMSGNAIEETATPIPATPTAVSHRQPMKFHPPPPPPPPPLVPSSPSASPSMESFRMSSKHNPHVRSTSDNSYVWSPPPPPPPPPATAADPIHPKDRTPDDQWASSQYSGTPSYYYQGSAWNGWEPFYPSSSPGIHGHERKKIKQEEFYQREDPMDDNSTDFEEEQEDSSFQHEVEGSSRAAGGKSPGREYPDDVSSVTSWYTKDTEMQMTVARRHLEEIVRNLDEYFVKASAAGTEVSGILETNRAQNEFETRKNLYHSSNVFNTLSWTWTSKPPLAIRYSLEPSKISSSSKHGSHCSTLESLLAWEKKLYEEVKNEEARKIEQEKKLSLLQNQKVKGENEIKMDKTQASIKRLQSLIMVARQAVTTTSSAIIKLRDNELCPQLRELSEGLMHMWRSMNECHQIQNSIVQQVKNLNLGTLASREFTSDNHRQATLQLEAQVTAWHDSFCSLIKFQREYIRALCGWARLSLLQLGNEAEWDRGNRPPIYTLCEEWQQALERLPDKVASESIKSFISVVHAIVRQQADEQKCKKKAENLSRELQKKMIALRNIEKKYYSSYSLPSRTDSPSESQVERDPTDPLAEKRTEIEGYKRRLADEKANYSKSARGTRAMTLNNIQTGLPGLFQAMSSFSSVCVRSFEDIYNLTKSLNDHSSVRC